MTEEEAKTKWCPFARVYSQIYITGEGSCSGGWNRHPDDKGDIPRCIGSACAAWRWDAWRCGEGCGTVRVGTIEKEFVEPCKPPRDPKFYDHIGHCGLAGKP